jgi:hypothetical protein
VRVQIHSVGDALKWKRGRGWGYGRAFLNLGEVVWVVDEVLALEWKGKGEYGRACWNMHKGGAGVGGG